MVRVRVFLGLKCCRKKRGGGPDPLDPPLDPPLYTQTPTHPNSQTKQKAITWSICVTSNDYSINNIRLQNHDVYPSEGCIRISQPGTYRRAFYSTERRALVCYSRHLW